MPTKVFLDETTLQEQFPTIEAFKRGVQFLSQVSRRIEDIKSAKGDISLCSKSSLKIFTYIEGMSREQFLGTLQRNDRMFYAQWKDLVGSKINYWDENPKQDEGKNYLVGTIPVTGTSFAEAWELESHSKFVFIFSSPQNSLITGNNISISESTLTKSIECFSDSSTLFDKFDNIYIRYYFNENLSRHPDDRETFLADPTKWNITGRVCNGAKVYENSQGTYVSYVDTFHTGRGHHVEFFEISSKKHLGCQKYDGTNIPNSRDPRKDNKMP